MPLLMHPAAGHLLAGIPLGIVRRKMRRVLSKRENQRVIEPALNAQTGAKSVMAREDIYRWSLTPPEICGRQSEF